MSNKVRYECEGCGNEIPEFQVEKRGNGSLCHTTEEMYPEPCGPVRMKVTVVIDDDPPKPWSPCWYETDGVYCPTCGKGPKETE